MARNVAGAKAPAGAAGKRRTRREAAPESPICPLGTRSMLFTERDIPALARTTGLPLAAGIDPKPLARALDSAFTMALTWHGTAARDPAPQELRHFLAGVEQQAADLLERLRVPQEPAPGELYARSQGWFLRIAPALNGDNPPMFWQRAPDDWYRDHIREVAAHETNSLAPDAGVDERRRATAVAANEAVLAGVPTMLRTLVAVARAARELQPYGPKRTGRRPSALSPSLFHALYLTHRAMFGTDPITRNSELDREGSGITWAKEVITLAAQRIEEVLLTPDPDAVAAIRSLTKLEAGGIGALLEKARAWAKKHPVT